MARWKINLFVLWTGCFLVMSGMTMIVPFLSLYIQEMGVSNSQDISMWAGAIFAGNFITAFLFQPFWGRLADRYGRKVMILRSGFGMAVIMMLMGLAATPWQLLLLRVANGIVSGFIPASVALLSANTPREKMGFAMGMLQSGQVGGTILGPLIGGLLAEWIGFRPIFFITGGLLFVASVLAWMLLKEKFDAVSAASQPKKSTWGGFLELCQSRELPAIYSVTFMIQFSMISAMPLIPLFVQELHPGGQFLAFFAGLVGSITGFSNMIASPLLGRLSDRIGPSRILTIALIGAGLAFIPQAMVTNIWQLFAARFILGMFLGGLLPSVQMLIRQYTPNGMESRSYSFNASFLSLGNMLGPIIGGLIYGYIGIRGLFLCSSLLLFVNALWVRKMLYRRKPSPTNASTQQQ